MKRRARWAILICLLLLLAGGAAWLLWPVGEPALVAKARMLRSGMTQEQARAILGPPDDWIWNMGIEYEYRGGHDLSKLLSARPPFIHPDDYRRSHRWRVVVYFRGWASNGDPLWNNSGPPSDNDAWLLTHAFYLIGETEEREQIASILSDEPDQSTGDGLPGSLFGPDAGTSTTGPSSAPSVP